MTDTTVLEASSRAMAGKGAARATRRAGLVPAVIYGARKAPTLVALDPRLVVREMSRPGFRSRIYEIAAGGVRERALIREIQLHPVSDKPLHVDFHRVAAGEAVRVEVAVVFEGEHESRGLKSGGVLNVAFHSVEVVADPERIPEHLVANVAGLAIGDAIHWSDPHGTSGLEPHGHDTDMVIATIAPPTVIQEPEPAPEAEAATGEADTGETAPETETASSED